MYTVTVTDGFNSSAVLDVIVEEPFLGCDASEECPAVLHLHDTIVDTVYQANGMLNARTLIESGAATLFKAGVNVLLESGFEVEQGAEFEVRIEGCDN